MEYILSMLFLMAIYVILSSSFNLIIGYCGLASVAHPIFFAAGAYTTGILIIQFNMHPVPATIAGGVVAALSSVALALPSLRISGDYLLISSIGFQLGLLEIIKHLGITGGASGLGNIPEVLPSASRTPVFAAVAWAIAIAVVVVIRWLMNGPYGYAVTAMRDDEVAFGALGRRAMMIKLSVFALGSGLGGVAGGIYALYNQFVSPDQFELLQSTTLLTMVVVGGMGSHLGPAIGSIILLLLPQVISFLNFPPSLMGPLQGLTFTVLVILFIFWRPQGLIAPSKRQ